MLKSLLTVATLSISTFSFASTPCDPYAENGTQPNPILYKVCQLADAAQKVAERLDITKKQMEQVTDIVKSYEQDIKEQFESVVEKQKTLVEAVKKDQDRESLTSVHADLLDARNQLETTLFNQFLDIKEIVGPEASLPQIN